MHCGFCLEILTPCDHFVTLKASTTHHSSSVGCALDLLQASCVAFQMTAVTIKPQRLLTTS